MKSPDKHTHDNTIRDSKLNASIPNPEEILRHIPIPVFICDEKGILIFWNKAFNELCTKTPAPGESVLDPETLPCFDTRGIQLSPEESPIKQVLQSGKSLKNKPIFLGEKGTQNFLMSASFLKDKKKKITGIQFSLQPVSGSGNEELKQARLSAIVESSDDAIISKDLKGYILSWNKGAERIFKYTEKEILGKHISMLVPENRQNDENIILKSIKKGERVDHFETVRIDKTGKEISLSLSVSPIKNSKGKIIGASKVARDISDRNKNEIKQARLSAIVEFSDDAIVSKDLNGIITSWNQGATRIFGYSEEEVIGKSVTILIPENRLKEEDHILNNIRNGKRIHHFETIRISKNGTEIPVSLSVSPIKDSNGNIIGASKIARNIEDQIRSKEKIKNYNRQLKILNAIGKDISSNLDEQKVLQKVTDAATELSGARYGAFFYNSKTEEGESIMLYTLSGASKKDFEKFGMPRHTDLLRPTFTGKGIIRVDDITKDKRYGNNPPHHGMPKGHLPVKSYMALPVMSAGGNVIGGLIFGHPKKGMFLKEHEVLVRNITAQAAITLDNSRLFERVKFLSEKKDEFIALASHELKTPLTTVKGYLQILEKKIEDPVSRLFLEKSLDQANKLNTLIDDLLNMSRIEAGKLDFQLEAFDLRAVLKDMCDTFNYGATTHHLIADLSENPVLVKGDQQRIEQAVSNFLTNAVKYSPMANKVYLDLTVEDEKATISVKDEGLGLNLKQQQQVFSRFYRAESTKGINGLGLGLYITKQIIDAHQGELGVNSKEGYGSEFYFSLPLVK